MEAHVDESDEVTRQIVTQLVELERIASALRMIDFTILCLGHAVRTMREAQAINSEDI